MIFDDNEHAFVLRRTERIKVKTREELFKNDDVDILNGICGKTYDKLLNYNFFYITYAPEMLEVIK